MTLRIHLERTGGFGGAAMRRSTAVDADALPALEAEELHGLVDAAGIPALAAQPKGTGHPRADAFHYRLMVDLGNGPHTIEVGDHEVPASLRPLLKWLIKRALPKT